MNESDRVFIAAVAARIEELGADLDRAIAGREWPRIAALSAAVRALIRDARLATGDPLLFGPSERSAEWLRWLAEEWTDE